MSWTSHRCVALLDRHRYLTADSQSHFSTRIIIPINHFIQTLKRPESNRLDKTPKFPIKNFYKAEVGETSSTCTGKVSQYQLTAAWDGSTNIFLRNVLSEIKTALMFIDNTNYSLTDKLNEDVVDHSGQTHKAKAASVFHFSCSQQVVSFTKIFCIQTTDVSDVKSAVFFTQLLSSTMWSEALELMSRWDLT